MKILGVDPGSRTTGWGLVEARGTRLAGLDAGVVRADSDAPLPSRLKSIYDGIVEVMEFHAPDVLAVEDIFHARYAGASLKLGQARGVVLLAGANRELPVCSYAPAVVKRTVAGRGAADKEQVARLVGAIVGWTKLPTTDATDAVAIAITHARAVRFARGRQRAARI